MPYRPKTVLLTGAAGFIGEAFGQRLMRAFPGVRLIGLDAMNDYYDPALKEARLLRLRETARAQGCPFVFERGSVADAETVSGLFSRWAPDAVVHLAAQAGVRYSISHPEAYMESNVTGFFNILEACRRTEGLSHLVYASSSSVYGADSPQPFGADSPTDRPVSLYAATKKADELFAHAYSKLYAIPSTGLRFFTAYGPWGRPDMAYFSFAEAMRTGRSIPLFNRGDLARDFTFIGDVTEAILRVLCRPPERADGADGLPLPPHRVYNVGCGRPVPLMEFVRTLYEALRAAGVLPEAYELGPHLSMLPMQPGDVPVTFADVSALRRDFGWQPETTLPEGLSVFASWYAGWTKARPEVSGD